MSDILQPVHSPRNLDFLCSIQPCSSLCIRFALTAITTPQEAVQAKGRASADLQQVQQQQAQSSEHLNLLKKQLAEERQSDAALSANLDSAQAELARYKTQVQSLLLLNVSLTAEHHIQVRASSLQHWCTNAVSLCALEASLHPKRMTSWSSSSSHVC